MPELTHRKSVWLALLVTFLWSTSWLLIKIDLVAGLVCLLATAYSAILGRAINRNGNLNPLNVTVISMGIGAPLMLLAGLLTEKWVPIALGVLVVQTGRIPS